MDTRTRIDPLTLPEIVDIIIPFLDRMQWLSRAAVVCRAWNQLYTPVLWRGMDIDREDNTPCDFGRQGIHVRQLRLGSFEDPHFDLIALFCPNIESLSVRYCNVTMETVAPYLRTLVPRLKRLELVSAMDSTDEFGSALAAGLSHGGDGGGSALEELELRCLRYGAEYDGLSVGTLVGIPDAYPGLKKIELNFIRILSLVTATENGCPLVPSEEEMATTTLAARMGNQDGGRGLQDDRFVKTHSALTYLFLGAAEIEHSTFVQLLRKTPRLVSLLIDSNKHFTGSVLDAFPTLYPELIHLTIIACSLDDQSLQHLALTQGDTLLDLTLCYCKQVTDSGVMAILSHCHRLISLSLSENPTVTVAIMMEDGLAERWSCYKTLRRLNIHQLGNINPWFPYARNDPRFERAQEALQKIQKRVRMLAKLEELGLFAHSSDVDLIRGYLGSGEGSG
ncbi:hypothetical protein BGX33_003898 [Mortierella sp. NVP41]|nr:hypothetical protein BGX33_003898 [Mortierella sp. NVP41]